MKPLEALLLWLVLLAPLMSVVITTQTLTAGAASRIGQTISLVSGFGWLLVTIAGDVQAGPVTANGPIGPAGVITALLVASIHNPITRRATAVRHAAMAVLMLGLVIGAGSGTTSDAFSGLAITAALLVAGAWRTECAKNPSLALGVFGTALVIIAANIDLSDKSAAGLLVLGLFVQMIAFMLASRTGDRAIGLMLAPSLVLAIPQIFASATGEPTVAWLLASAFMLIMVAPSPLTTAAAIPGLFVLVSHLANGVTFYDAVVNAAFGAMLALSLYGFLDKSSLPRSSVFDKSQGLDKRVSWACAGLGAWLIVAPSTWGWVMNGTSDQLSNMAFAHWSEGTGPVVAVVAIVTVVSMLLGRQNTKSLSILIGSLVQAESDPVPSSVPSVELWALIGSCAVLLLAFVVLVQSI